MQVLLEYLLKSLAIIIVISVMGFTKAYTSYKLGDKAIKNMGKVSLNPKNHFEIIGFILFLATGYGWTAPIDTNAMYYKNRKKGNILICVIPLIMAIIFAFFTNIIFLISKNMIYNKFYFYFITFISSLTIYFINFAVFNLIPAYPLLGQKLFQNILPTNVAIVLSQYEKIIQIIVLLLLISGFLNGILTFMSAFILNIISILSSFIVGFI